MKRVKIKEIAVWAEQEGFAFEFQGNSEEWISGFSSLSNYLTDTITWINIKSIVDDDELRRIKFAVVQKGVEKKPDNCIITKESKRFFFGVLKSFFCEDDPIITQRKNTYIGDSVKIGDNVTIGSNCVIDGDIVIGDNTVIEHSVTLMNKIVIGNDCIIHSGTVIGKDGFGFSIDNNWIPHKAAHFGGVRIGNRVEIGGNCVIDRGTIDDTLIGDDTKIDNLVLIAHNVSIGKACIIVGHTDIAGSCIIGDYSYIAPQVCIENKKKVGSNSFIGMGGLVHEDIGDNMMLPKLGAVPMKNKDYRRFL